MKEAKVIQHVAFVQAACGRVAHVDIRSAQGFDKLDAAQGFRGEDLHELQTELQRGLDVTWAGAAGNDRHAVLDTIRDNF